VLVAVWLAVPPPAVACPWYNPLCWLEEAADYFTDLVEDLADLTVNVVTLDPAGAFNDLVDIVENQVCAAGAGTITVLDLIGADVAEALYNDSCAPPHGIAPEVLERLRPYFQSEFTSVLIHEDCDFPNFSPASAITFGEHIYFKSGTYNPSTPDGFARLAHELTHVLQYRRTGFADFICEYWPTCQFGLNPGCGLEQQGYMYEALVRDDVARDGDGIFTCALDAHEWNGDNVAAHTCAGKALLDNCPTVASANQGDTDGDGSGDVCDPGNQCTPGQTKHEACPADAFWGDGLDYVCNYGYWKQTGGWCKPKSLPDDLPPVCSKKPYLPQCQ
jgi:hypothetical protein